MPLSKGQGLPARLVGPALSKRVSGSLMQGVSITPLFAPVAGIAKLAVDRAGGDLGDERKAPLVLGGLNLCENGPDESLVETSRDDLRDFVPAINHQAQNLVDLVIAEAEFPLIGLPDPEIAAGRLSDNSLRDAHVP